MKTYVLATANPHKTEEIREILAGLDLRLLPRPDDVPEVIEDGETLEENALLKARALATATFARVHGHQQQVQITAAAK